MATVFCDWDFEFNGLKFFQLLLWTDYGTTRTQSITQHQEEIAACHCSNELAKHNMRNATYYIGPFRRLTSFDLDRREANNIPPKLGCFTLSCQLSVTMSSSSNTLSRGRRVYSRYVILSSPRLMWWMLMHITDIYFLVFSLRLALLHFLAERCLFLGHQGIVKPLLPCRTLLENALSFLVCKNWHIMWGCWTSHNKYIYITKPEADQHRLPPSKGKGLAELASMAEE